jgi:3-dehydroquinate dehydratase
MSGLSVLASIAAAGTLISAPLQTAPPDTMVVVAARDAVDVIYAVAAGAFALVFVVLLVAMLRILLIMNEAGRRLEALGQRIASDPGIESLRKVSANLESMSTSAREEVEHLRGSVSRLSDRLTQVSDRMEERIEEFNALMEVIQAEAEGAFVDTAAAARGVRTGVGNVGRAARKGEVPGRKRPGSGDGDAPGTGEAGGDEGRP